MWRIAWRLSVLILTVSLLISFANQTREPRTKTKIERYEDFTSPKHWPTSDLSPVSTWIYPSVVIQEDEVPYDNNPLNTNPTTFTDDLFLQYDYYHNSCPHAERIVRSVIHHLYKNRSDVAPALLRLLFHDCFIQGCDASVLLDAIDGLEVEKDTPPNQTLKGFDIIEMIKSKIEEACPATVSCADILVLAAREGILLAGGPFYPVYTGRRDSELSFPEVASYELPSPHDDLPKTILSFTNKGFSERETVSLLGAHSIGVIHCQFFSNRLYNYSGTGRPDSSLETGLLKQMRSKCNNSSNTYSSEEPGIVMDYEGAEGSKFGKGTHYYRGLVEGRGILHADQQLMTSEGTASWVRAYASDSSLFQRDFAQVMIKLSNYQVLTKPLGQIRLNCSQVA